MKFRVYVRSLPAIGRTYYEGFVDVDVRDYDRIDDAAKVKLNFIHGHRDWVIREVVRRDRVGTVVGGDQ